MKRKQKIDFIIACILTGIGVVLLCLPLMKINNINFVLNIVFIAYIVLNIIRFILTKESKDVQSLLNIIATLIALIINLIYHPYKTPRTLAIFIMTWILLMSISKLKKADYYHDRRDRMWKISCLNLVLFIVTGILVSINLAYSASVQILMFGFFILINGILEIFDPIVKILIAHS